MRIVGLGLDATEVPRIAAMLDQYGDRFRHRVYTAGEIAYCDAKEKRGAAASYAARFAAKEAVSKAFGTGIGASLGWLDIEVRRKASGEPFVILHGEGAKTAARLGILELRLTLSHSDHYAVAHALALGE